MNGIYRSDDPLIVAENMLQKMRESGSLLTGQLIQYQKQKRLKISMQLKLHGGKKISERH